MTNKSWALAAFLMLSPLAVADSVVITKGTSCVTNGGSILDPSSCSSVGVPNGSATADASASYSISGNTLTIDVFDEATVVETIDGASNSASAQSSISIDILTAGSVRPGIAVQTGAGDAGGSQGLNEGASAYSTLGGLGGYGLMCVSPRGCQGDYPSHSTLSITLGTDLNLSARSYTGASALPDNIGVSGVQGGAEASETLKFFEADGVTPVDISLATPEPSTWAFLSLGLLCFVGTRLKRINPKNGILALLLMIPSLAKADTVAITTSTSCATSQISVSDPSACNLPGVSANASDSYSISGNTLTFISNLIASATSSYPGNIASASDSLTLDFTTPGPVRNGVIVPVAVTVLPQGGSRFYGDSGGFVGTFGLDGFGAICQTYNYCVFPPMPSYSVLLGTNLELTENSQVEAQTIEITPISVEGGTGALDLSYSFEFFEADGVTPVDISLATPEPATLTLFAFPLLIACFLIAFRRFRPYPL